MKEEFLLEFRALLEKYNVGISFSVDPCSDTHGLYDEKMVIYHQEPNSIHAEDWFEVYGYSIDKSDLPDIIKKDQK